MATIVFGVGYVGSALVQELLYEGRDVIGVDNFFATDRRAIDGFTQSPTFRFINGSITDASTIERTFEAAGDTVEEVYLLAAQASANAAAATTEYTEDTNLRGPRVILDAVCRRHSAAKVVFASSTRVYGSPLPLRVDETIPYGAFTDLSHLSKCYVEKLIEMYAETRGISGRSVRLGLTFGVAPVMKTDRRFMTAPNLFCAQAAMNERIEVRSVDPVALIHISDAVHALRLAAGAQIPDCYAVFNATSEVAPIGMVAELVVEIAAQRDLRVEVDGWDLDASHPFVLRTIVSRLSQYGFAPGRTLREGLTEALDHFLVRGQ